MMARSAPAPRTTQNRRELGLDGFSPTELSSTVAVVTGGGRGIGRLLSCALAGAGASVGVVARSGHELADTVAAIEATGGVAAAATADVTDDRALQRALARLRDLLGPVDVLVNNAGVLGPIGPAWDVDAAAWWRTMDINLRGLVNATRLVVPEMITRRRGRIINLTSQAGTYRWPLLSAYSVSKAAVVKLTENLAYETARHGISVFSVHPGLLPIGLGETGLHDGAGSDSYLTQIRVWVDDEIAHGRGADPAAAMHMMLRIARGDADPLSGRHLSVHDDLDALLERIKTIRDRDLYVMRPGLLASDAQLSPVNPVHPAAARSSRLRLCLQRRARSW
jgi:NAD(P)-dependent dehydrogenase (short-subunit alcohol dehydrogenase family)